MAERSNIARPRRTLALYERAGNSESCRDPFDFAQGKTFARHDNSFYDNDRLPLSRYQ